MSNLEDIKKMISKDVALQLINQDKLSEIISEICSKIVKKTISEDEVEKRVNQKIITLYEKLVKDLKIPMAANKLRMMVDFDKKFCNGIKQDGKLCECRSSDNSGFCKHHKNQAPQIKENVSSISHNHPFPSFKIHNDCPACNLEK